MTEFCALRAKAYAYKLDDDTEMKKAKGTKKCIVKREITFKNYADALFNDEVIIKSQQRFRSDHHKVYSEEVNKIALSSNDDKRIQTIDKVTTHPYGTNAFKVCELEMKMRMGNMNMQNEICELKIDNADMQNEICELKTDNADMQNEICELKIDNADKDKDYDQKTMIRL